MVLEIEEKNIVSQTFLFLPCSFNPGCPRMPSFSLFSLCFRFFQVLYFFRLIQSVLNIRGSAVFLEGNKLVVGWFFFCEEIKATANQKVMDEIQIPMKPVTKP